MVRVPRRQENVSCSEQVRSNKAMMKAGWRLLLSLPFVLGSSSCERAQRQPVVISEQGISEKRIRQLATEYRDQWLAKNAVEDSAQLARGVIQSVEKIAGAWHVVFATRTGGGPGAEEGLHVYFLHVYLTLSGALDRVVRGPDLLS